MGTKAPWDKTWNGRYTRRGSLGTGQSEVYRAVMSESEVEPASLGMPSDEVTGSNAGEDAVMGTVANEPPSDPDNPPMDEGLTPDPEPPPEVTP